MRKPAPFRPIAQPPAAEPALRQLIDVLNDRQITLAELERKSGVAYQTVKRWRRHDRGRRSPNLSDMEAVANAVGLTLALVPISAKPVPEKWVWKTPGYSYPAEGTSGYIDPLLS